jgi:methylated-DNA-[protein]-cysteine S-methyltransferase
MTWTISEIKSPLGDLYLVTNESSHIVALDFLDHKANLHRNLRNYYGTYELQEGFAPEIVRVALNDYFSGDLEALSRLAISTAGNELQHQVWNALRAIPPGSTVSYGELARSLGYQDPRMAIEVGAANRVNPIALIVPCHRVIAKNGDLKGYAWGIHRKRWLLEHEGAPLLTSMKPSETEPLPGFN